MPSKKHDFTLVEIKAGVMVVVSGAVLALFVAVLTGLRTPETMKTFHAYFTDTKGLNKGGDVRFGGVKKGRVVRIEPDDADQSRIKVTFAVGQEVPVNAKSAAFVTQTTLTAEPHLEITTGEPDASLLEDGVVVPEAEGTAGGLFGALDEMAKSVVPVLDDVKELLGVEEHKGKAGETDEELVTITAIFSDVADAVKESTDLVKDVRGVIGDSSDDVATILTKVQDVEDSAKELVDQLNRVLEENRAGIKGSIEGAQRMIDNVVAVSGRLDEVASSLQVTLDNAEGLTGDAKGLIQDNRPVLEDILLDLRETVRHLKTFARTMAEEPEAVIRGKTPHGRK